MNETTTKTGKSFGVPLMLRIVWSILRRRWLPIGLACVIAFIAGAFGSKPLTEKVWRAQCLLLYTAPSVDNDIASMRDTLELANVSGLATSRPVLYEIKDELGLDLPTPLLAKALKVETQRKQNTVFVTLDWGDQNEAVQILEQLTETFPRHVAKIRQEIAQASLESAQQMAAGTRNRLEAARIRHRDFTRDNHIVDYKQDLNLLLAKILDLETKASKIKRDEESFKDQIKMLDDHINNVKKEEEEEAQQNQKFEAASESLADNRRRQNRLRELIAEERRIAEIRAQIIVKRREYERAKRLADKKLIANSKLEVIRSELESLIARIAENEKILKWKTELEELDKLVVPKNKVTKRGSPIIQQILAKKLQKQLDIAHGQRTLLEIEAELSRANAQVATYQKLRGELTSLEDDIETLHQEVLLVERKASLFREVATMGPTEFTIVSPVSTGAEPLSSNRKKMFLAIVAAVLLLTLSTITAYDVFREGIIPPDAQIEMMGLKPMVRYSLEIQEENNRRDQPDVVANQAASVNTQRKTGANSETILPAKNEGSSSYESESDGVEYEQESQASIQRDDDIQDPPFSGRTQYRGRQLDYPEPVRRLGLKLRREVPDPGSVILVSNFEDPESLDELILDLSKCFAARDERVLILDARPAGDGLGPFADLLDKEAVAQQIVDSELIFDDETQDNYLPGLRDWLTFRFDQLEDVTLETGIPGVDCILPGLSDSDEVLCTIRMTDGIQRIRERYTITLLLCHSAMFPTEVEVLSAYADSIVFAYDPTIRVQSGAGKVVAALEKLEAPLLGSIEL